jgi:small subunit ribosomal protein S11
MNRIQVQGLLAKISSMEVVLRDFGPGREAATKILLGAEGKNVRSTIVRVMDATRLKFGGTRGKKPRRLG